MRIGIAVLTSDPLRIWSPLLCLPFLSDASWENNSCDVSAWQCFCFLANYGLLMSPEVKVSVISSGGKCWSCLVVRLEDTEKIIWGSCWMLEESIHLWDNILVMLSKSMQKNPLKWSLKTQAGEILSWSSALYARLSPEFRSPVLIKTRLGSMCP